MYCDCVCVRVYNVTDVATPASGSPDRRTRPDHGPHSSSSPRRFLTLPPVMDPAHRPQKLMSKHFISAQEALDTFLRASGKRKGHPCMQAALSTGQMCFLDIIQLKNRMCRQLQPNFSWFESAMLLVFTRRLRKH